MYAVVKNSGKQYKMKIGEVVKLEKLDLGVGEKVEFDSVLMPETADGEV